MGRKKYKGFARTDFRIDKVSYKRGDAYATTNKARFDSLIELKKIKK